ncbi:hypothetical protein OSTOST_19880 [Ostertagia ostertagi]
MTSCSYYAHKVEAPAEPFIATIDLKIDKDDTCVMYSVLAYDATSEIHETIVMVLIKDETGKVRSHYFKYQVITDKTTKEQSNLGLTTWTRLISC